MNQDQNFSKNDLKNKHKALVLGYCPKSYASTCIDHFKAFKRFSKFDVYELSSRGDLPKWLNLEDFDILIIHYSIHVVYENWLSKTAVEKIKSFTGVKAIYVQDEYQHVNAFKNMLGALGVDLLFTCVPTQEIQKVYPDSEVAAKKINVLTGYVQENLLKYPRVPIKDRQIDVGYRARKLSAWYGALAQEKWTIVDRFKEELQKKGETLKTDLSYHEEDRIYGESWIKFIQNCKVALGVESGAGVFDFTGEIQKKVEAFEQNNPQATFEEIKERFFKDLDGVIYLNQISPRCFEAAALGTPMLLYEGNYSGVLAPWRHYIPLKKDFSNFEQVLELIKNDEYLQELARRTYKEVAKNPAYTYRAMISSFDTEADAALALKRRLPSKALSLKQLLLLDFHTRLTLGQLKYLVWLRYKLYQLKKNIHYKLYRVKVAIHYKLYHLKMFVISKVMPTNNISVFTSRTTARLETDGRKEFRQK